LIKVLLDLKIKLIITLGFEENANFIRRKLAKIVIMTSTPDWAVVYFRQFLKKLQKEPKFLGYLPLRQMFCIIFLQKWIWARFLAVFFTNSSGHPG
jgi:hypothetical protein